ncbi:hypothetical protein J6Y50_10230 [bacterium]|nr:hypothetical protein [bacterium]
MIIELSRLLGTKVLSLQLGAPIGEVVDAIVDPDNLKILALRLRGPMIDKNSGDILTVDSIREFGRLGIIINSDEELVERNIVSAVEIAYELLKIDNPNKERGTLKEINEILSHKEGWRRTTWKRLNGYGQQRIAFERILERVGKLQK